MTKVAVALSGGIDSAVTAALLLEQGYEVVGVTGKMTCSEDSDLVVLNAKKVTEKLGIEHYAIDLSEIFQDKVIKYFEDSYRRGKTPNPCIMCNKYIKWGTLFNYSLSNLSADFIATGHYANINFADGVYKLYPASDEHKDQLYFLFLLSQECMAKTIFPLSGYKKTEVRSLAEKYDLPPKSAKESQDICFIKPPMTTKKHLLSIFGAEKGCFIEKSSGKILGTHDGYWQYTVGQRKGIGIAAPEALYVLGTEPSDNVVYLGYKNELEVDKLVLENVYWSYPHNNSKFEALVKIRYNMKPVLAEIICKSDSAEIVFSERVSAIASGQACVIYDKNDGHLIGGGFI